MKKKILFFILIGSLFFYFHVHNKTIFSFITVKTHAAICSVCVEIPKLGTLYITGNTPYKMSGLRNKYATDGPVDNTLPPSINGSSFANGIVITQKIDNSLNAEGGIENEVNVGLSGVAFGGKTGTALSCENKNECTIKDLINAANSNKGFILVYVANSDNVDIKDTGTYVSDGSTTLLYNTYYAYYYNGNWQKLKKDSYTKCGGFWIKNEETYGTLRGLSPKFKVILLQNIGERSWKTYGYIRTAGDEDIIQALEPQNDI